MIPVKYKFEWDAGKAKLNIRKHSVSFEEAMTVFGDPLAFVFDDDSHSGEECRELIIGHSIAGRLMVVNFTERPNSILRIISARAATTREGHDYEENRKI